MTVSWARTDSLEFVMSCFENSIPNPSLSAKSDAATATYHWSWSKAENKFRPRRLGASSSEVKRLKMSPSPTFETDEQEDGAVPLQFRSKWQIVSLWSGL